MTLAPQAPLEVFLLGTVEVDSIQALQRRLVYEFGEREGGALVLCEHPPTITVGRNGSRAHIRADDDELVSWGVRVKWVNRGRGVVLHMPGQIAMYAVLPLSPLGLDVRGYVDGLERVLTGTLGEFGMSAEAQADFPGAYLGPERVGTIGIAVNRWIAYYGLTLNVGPFLAPFGLLEEPGPNGQAMRYTSMEARRQRPTPVPKVKETLVRQFEEVFGLQRHVVFTDHPLLRSKAASHVYV
jgi:lipoyl(octanoyl) transferase